MLRRRSSIRVLLVALVAMAMVASLPGSAMATSSSTQSYIVQGSSVDQVTALVEAAGGKITSRLDVIDGVGAVLSPEAAEQLQKQPGIRAVTSNAPVEVVAGDWGEEGGQGRRSPATDYPDVTGADQVWSERTNGDRVTVAVLDTGIGRHRGLMTTLTGLGSHIVGWKDFVDGKRIPTDPNGHGTHVAGIIANTQIGEDREYNGMAPGADLVGVRVLDENGIGTYENVIRGIQWVLDNQDRYNIRVMNLSLIAKVQSPYWADPMNQAIMQAWANGITVVVAAGNSGPGPMTIGVPGNNPYVITVGAFTDAYSPSEWNDDYITPFSAAGPTLDGFVKPDIVAPGAHIVSTMLPNTMIARDHDANQVTNSYFSMAGTSQAAGVVSGAAALVLSRNQQLSPDEVKYRLLVTAFPWVDPETKAAAYSVWQQGFGRVNVVDAVQSDIEGTANTGMDIQADLDGVEHYEGYSYYDETTGLYRLRGDDTGWANGFGTWSGKFGTWSGGFGTWSGKFGTWSGKFGTWSGNFSWDGHFSWDGSYSWDGNFSWDGGFGTWSGKFGTWSGGFGTWSGGFGTWSGGVPAWTGGEPWAGTEYSDAGFVENFMAGNGLDASTTSTSINDWVEEP